MRSLVIISLVVGFGSLALAKPDHLAGEIKTGKRALATPENSEPPSRTPSSIDNSGDSPNVESSLLEFDSMMGHKPASDVGELRAPLPNSYALPPTSQP